MVRLWHIFLLLTLLVCGPAHAETGGWTGLDFDVMRNGKRIGEHRVRFHVENGDLIVDTDVNLNVYFAFIKVYSYVHHSREVWRNNRLWTLNAQTNDNGKSFNISGRAVENGFELTGVNGTLLAPAGIIPTSYWNPATRMQTQLLETVKGRLFPVTVIDEGGGHVKLTGKLQLDMWYNDAGCFQRLSFTPPRDKTLIEYVPALPESTPETTVTPQQGLRSAVEQCYPARTEKMAAADVADREASAQK